MLMICQKLNRGFANVICNRLDPESTKNSREYRTETGTDSLLQTFVVGKLNRIIRRTKNKHNA